MTADQIAVLAAVALTVCVLLLALWGNWIRPLRSERSRKLADVLNRQVVSRPMRVQLTELRPWLLADTDQGALNGLLTFLEKLREQGVSALAVTGTDFSDFQEMLYDKARQPMTVLERAVTRNIIVIVDERGTEVDLRIWPQALLVIEDYEVRRQAHLSYVRERINEL